MLAFDLAVLPALTARGDTEGGDEPGAWSRFVGPWRRAHRVRTGAALAAAVLGAVAVGVG